MLVFDLDSLINYRRAMIAAHIDTGITKEAHEWDEVLSEPNWLSRYENGEALRTRVVSKLPPYGRLVTPTVLLPIAVSNGFPVISTLRSQEVLILIRGLVQRIPAVSNIRIVLAGATVADKAFYMDAACKTNDRELTYVHENPVGLAKLRPRTKQILGASRWDTVNVEGALALLK